MLTPTEAAQQITADVKPLSVHCIPLLDVLDGVLATDVHSGVDIPAWDNSAMDGYAVRGNDLRKRAQRAGAGAAVSNVELRVVETIPAAPVPTKAAPARRRAA